MYEIKKEVEQAILAQLMTNKKSLECVELLSGELFTTEFYRTVFETIRELNDLKQEIDLQIVYTSLKKKIPDASISNITGITNCLSFNNINYYVEQLKDLDERIKLKDKLAGDLFRVDDLNLDTEGLKADISSEIERMIKAEAKGSSIDQATYEFIDFLEKCMTTKNEDMHYGIPTVDRHTGGISDGQLITIGAKSGVGKSSFAMYIATRVAKRKKVLYISREMSKAQIVGKMVSKFTGISLASIKNGLNEDDAQRVIQANGYINEEFKDKLFIDDASCHINDIKIAIKKIKPDLVIVDYLQLLDPVNAYEKNRERQVAQLSRELKKVTLDYNLPIIQLSQLNDESKDQRPKGDRVMRESKAIYQDSNVVIYLHEPNLNELEKIINDCYVSRTGYKEFVQSGRKLIEIILDKNRDGENNKIARTWFSGKTMSFAEIKKSQ